MSAWSPEPQLPPPLKRPSFLQSLQFILRPLPRRWPWAARAALCMGVPLACGLAIGDLRAGVIASLGAFTSLYGGDRPYHNRAILLAIVALAFSLLVCFGVCARPSVLASVALPVVVAVSSTFLCNALNIGPPGAYMFVLACAVGSALPTEPFTVWQIGLLVLSGGAFSWCVQMAGMLFRPRGPESDALNAAAAATAQFVQSIGTQREDYTRHAAALSLYDAWTKLVALQPKSSSQSPALNRLRASNRELHRLFVRYITAVHPGGAADSIDGRPASLVAEAGAQDPANAVFEAPLGHYGIRESICESMTWSSIAALAAVRVGLAATFTGVISVAMGLERAYWMVAASVLVLHQGLDWTRTFQRSVERVVGTFVGLGFAGVLLSLHFGGAYLVAVLTVLQFVIEMVVVRSYALAVVFITAMALVIASGGYAVRDLGHLLWVRGLDTVLGCLIGLGVHVFTAPRSLAVPIPRQILRTLAAAEAVLPFLKTCDLTSASARRTRRDLQHRAIALFQAFELGVGASATGRQYAEHLWPSVVATQRLAYRILGACWSLEDAGHEEAIAKAAALFPGSSFDQTQRLLADLREAVQGAKKPEISSELPPFLQCDLKSLAESLAARQ